MVPFARKLAQLGFADLTAEAVNTLQVNLGWRCNQACRHCHLAAGPDRPEQMGQAAIDAVINAVARWAIPVVDLTGGAPEINPYFEYLVQRLAQLDVHLLVRCNLTILLEPDYEHLPEFFRDHRVELVCSLPYFQEDPVDRLRGPGVFRKSLEALRRLNRVGYGREASHLALHLMYNPAGAYLPPEQGPLEDRFQQELKERYDIDFNRLYTLLNMPIGRFLDFLMASGNYDGYMQRLVNAFNPVAAAGVMCRYIISVGWDGTLYDCDYNQMLTLPLGFDSPKHVRDFDAALLHERCIVTRNHCYGCAAGPGSSCGGSIT